MHVTKQQIKNFVVDNLKSYVKFQMIPASFCGLACSIMSGITTFTGITFGIDLFQLIQNPLFITLVGILSFVYIVAFYPEQLFRKYRITWYKHLHTCLAISAGMIAAFIAYFLPQFPFLVNTIATKQNFDLSTIKATFGPVEIPAMIVLLIGFFAYNWIAKGIFISMDDKPHFFFTTNESRLDRYIIKLSKIFTK